MAIIMILTFLAIAACCWILVREADREEDDAEQEEYLTKWAEENKK